MVTIQAASLALAVVVHLVVLVATIVGAYWKLQRSFDKRFEDVTAEFTKRFEEFRLQLNTLVEGDVRELRARVTRLEENQNEWLKVMRDRNNDLSSEVQRLVLRVDRLERPGSHEKSIGG